jgi:phage-related protein
VQAAAVVRDFTSAPIKRSPFSYITSKFVNIRRDIFDDIVDKGGDVLDAAKSVGNDIVEGTGKAVDAAKDLVSGAGEQIGEIVDSGSGAVVDFVDSVRVHYASPLIEADQML